MATKNASGHQGEVKDPEHDGRLKGHKGGEAAKALHTELAAGFTPFDVRADGLLLWWYRGGPWEAAGAFPFSAVAATSPCTLSVSVAKVLPFVHAEEH